MKEENKWEYKELVYKRERLENELSECKNVFERFFICNDLNCVESRISEILSE